MKAPLKATLDAGDAGVVRPAAAAPSPLARVLRRLALDEDLNFLLTNRIPRIQLTRLMGWYSRIQHPWVRDASIAVWRAFTDLDLSDARERERWRSLHDCFTRRLVDGARPADPDPAVLASPSDGIVGQCGRVIDGQLFQAKGFPYSLRELFAGSALADEYRHGTYVTLRLTSAMYHRFHAPHDLSIDRVEYISGDTWNVNPIALARVERLFCRNERALVTGLLARGGHRITMVPVAAVLVASIRLVFLDTRLHLRYKGPNRIDCRASFHKGDELGWFEHGSTIIVFAPEGFTLAPGIESGRQVRAGQALMELPA